MFWVVSQSRRWRHPSEEFAKLLARTLLLQPDMLASSVFLETSIPNIPSITVPSFHLVYSARAPLRTTLYAGSTLTRIPRYRRRDRGRAPGSSSLSTIHLSVHFRFC